MIEINKLIGFSLEELNVLLEGKNIFEFAFPKSTQLFFNTNEDVSRDYLRGAFIGQELSKISSSFEYVNIPATDLKNFQYTITCDDPEQLAEKIRFFTYALDNGTEDDYFDFMEAESDFEGKLDVIEIACPGMIETYRNYVSDSDMVD